MPDASKTGSGVLLIGNAVLLLGIVLALAGGIRHYAKNAKKLARWGGFLSTLGASIVLIRTGTEVSPGRDFSHWVEFGVLWIAAIIVTGLLTFPCLQRLQRRALCFIEKKVQWYPKDKHGQSNPVVAQSRRTDDNEVRPEQENVDGGQHAQVHTDPGQP